MSIFKVGDRVRLVYSKSYPERVGRTAKISAVGPYLPSAGPKLMDFYIVYDVSGEQVAVNSYNISPILPRPELSAMTYGELMLSLSGETRIVSIAELLRETFKVVSV